MYLLGPQDHARVEPLVADMRNHLSVVAALAGNSPAHVYVDDPTDPQVVLVDVLHRRMYLAGQSGSSAAAAIGRLFEETICPQVKAAGVGAFSFVHTPIGWEHWMEALLPGKETILAQREYYEIDTAQLPLLPMLPEGFNLRQVDAGLLAETQLRHRAELLEEMCSERATIEEFLTHSFGICPVTEDAIAGWCMSEYNTGDRCEVGIATLEEYQRRGLATAVGAAFVVQARSAGIARVGWHCYARNRPSGATALKIGFRKVDDFASCIVLQSQ